jgi:hypothetical protein
MAISEDNWPIITTTSALNGGSRSPIHVYRNGIFTLELGPVKLTRKLLVADIEDDVLLGFDVLMGERLLSKGVIQLQGHCIPCITPGERCVRCILRSADELTISAMSEAVVSTFIERTAQDGPGNEYD